MGARNGLSGSSIAIALSICFSLSLWSTSVCWSTAPPAAATSAAPSTFRVAVFEHIPIRGQLGDSRAKALGVMHENLGVYERQMERASLLVSCMRLLLFVLVQYIRTRTRILYTTITSIVH